MVSRDKKHLPSKREARIRRKMRADGFVTYAVIENADEAGCPRNLAGLLERTRRPLAVP